MFRIGQKVVCVDADIDCGCGCSTNLSLGAIYTIKCARFDHGGVQEIELQETEPVGWSSGYASTRFRPVVERKTNIEIFKKMLVPQRKSAFANS